MFENLMLKRIMPSKRQCLCSYIMMTTL